jgi:hypothetical protein
MRTAPAAANKKQQTFLVFFIKNNFYYHVPNDRDRHDILNIMHLLYIFFINAFYASFLLNVTCTHKSKRCRTISFTYYNNIIVHLFYLCERDVL